MATKELVLDNIQGNILGGFNKDFQSFLFLKFTSKANGRAWIKEIVDSNVGIATSSSAAVLKFNAQFKALAAAGIVPETVIAAEWTNLAISFQGLTTLGISAADLTSFPIEFSTGMAGRKAQIGDAGSSDPTHWKDPFKSGAIHALLVVAADSETDLKARVSAITGTAAFAAGVSIVDKPVEGRTRVDERGHEHFGFKDGVSQPGIRGVTPPDDPIANPRQAHPGQDLLWPGEFVLGYPTQQKTAKPGVDGPNPDPGPVSTSGPTWTADGSYLVFRRLAQDVPAFRKQILELAAAHGLSEDLTGAKLVGRYKTGCPIERRTFGPASSGTAFTDPGIGEPGLADSDSLNNNFEFGEDPVGQICPAAAHIRKAYPRDEDTGSGNNSESDTQTHRLLRRGIPFGHSFGAATGGASGDPRGLLFLCYQKDIGKQFEFVQTSWINNAAFPPAPATTPGQDPIIAQSATGSFQLDPTKPNITLKHFVTTTGGEYFFAPSIDALRKLGNNTI